MKRSTVPAQITTVEDTILGNLTALQLVLLVFPICFGFISFAVLPPNFHFVLYKLVTMLVLLLVGAILQMRIKDKLLLMWIITVIRYNVRPRFYIYNKNDAYGRDMQREDKDVKQQQTVAAPTPAAPKLPKIAIPEAVKLEEIMSDPRAKLRFKAGKKGLHVVINEIK